MADATPDAKSGGRSAVPLGATGEAVRENIRRLRAAQGFSTRQLELRLAMLGRPIPSSGITRLELGQRRVDVDDLVALATAFNVTPGQLLTPFDCTVCHGQPPAGFTCQTCGAEG
jgi:hypothetical protein